MCAVHNHFAFAVCSPGCLLSVSPPKLQTIMPAVRALVMRRCRICNSAVVVPNEYLWLCHNLADESGTGDGTLWTCGFCDSFRRLWRSANDLRFSCRASTIRLLSVLTDLINSMSHEHLRASLDGIHQGLPSQPFSGPHISPPPRHATPTPAPVMVPTPAMAEPQASTAPMTPAPMWHAPLPATTPVPIMAPAASAPTPGAPVAPDQAVGRPWQSADQAVPEFVSCNAWTGPYGPVRPVNQMTRAFPY